MSRIMYPEDYLSQRELFKTINAKHTADGPASPIKPFLTQQSIDLAADATRGTDADTREDARKLLSKQSENFRQLRDLKFDPVFQRLRGMAQFLKGFYKPNVSELGNWGITVDNGDRLVYPSDFLGRHRVFTDFKAKYDSYAGAVTPLDPYLAQHTINLTNDETDATAAFTYNTNFAQSAADSEDATQDRNNLWHPVMAHVRSIGDFLKKLYNDNAKQLGYWGYVVDESPRPPKLQISTIKLSSQITIKGVVVGGTLNNIGPVDMHIYKGQTTTGTPSIVHPGEVLGMPQDFSTITVVNPSTLETGKIKVLVNK